jgi:hypothetical protein
VIGPDWDFFVRYADLASFGYLDDRTGLYRVHRTNITSQVNSSRRAAYLAICRENAIKMASFAGCAPETRAAVFYDLMVTLLRGQPDRREAVTAWSEFADLPGDERSRLLRLMAASAVLYDPGDARVSQWFARASALCPSDRKARLLDALYRIHPGLCRTFLRFLSPFRTETTVGGPFADLEAQKTSGARSANAMLGG